MNAISFFIYIKHIIINNQLIFYYKYNFIKIIKMSLRSIYGRRDIN